ncbi:MAG: hypothetical protein QM793_10970 [Muricomes sp.]
MKKDKHKIILAVSAVIVICAVVFSYISLPVMFTSSGIITRLKETTANGINEDLVRRHSQDADAKTAYYINFKSNQNVKFSDAGDVKSDLEYEKVFPGVWKLMIPKACSYLAIDVKSGSENYLFVYLAP